MWVSTLAFPIGFTLIALRLALRSSPHWAGRAVASAGSSLGILAAYHYEFFEGRALLPWIVARPRRRRARRADLRAARRHRDGGRSSSTAAGRSCRSSRPTRSSTSPSANLAAIPLFTLTGFLLAEGKSSERLLRALRALFGWAPGGTAVAAATLCAFFTLFTGGSGVTILALGGLLLPALLKEGYRERFSIGLLTASGSLGLLFPLVGAADPLRHRRAERRDRGSVHRRPDSRAC